MNSFEERLKEWVEDSEFDLKLHRSYQDYPLSGDPLWITRCLKLIAVIRKQMEALKSIKWQTGYARNWAPDVDQPQEDYCKINRVLVEHALQECEEML